MVCIIEIFGRKLRKFSRKNYDSIFILFTLSQHPAIELSKLPAKKRLTQLKAQQQQQQQNAILNSTTPTTHSSISIIPINNQAHSVASSLINSNNNSIKTSLSDRSEPMDMEDDEEINVHDDSPLDMRITKHDSDDSVRPSVIRRAPSFKESNSNSSSGKYPFNRICGFIITNLNSLLDNNVVDR